MAKEPPIPPENRNPHDSDPHAPDPTGPAPGKAPAASKTGDQENIRQNTTHPGTQQDR